jgi:hypothetical protein
MDDCFVQASLVSLCIASTALVRLTAKAELCYHTSVTAQLD